MPSKRASKPRQIDLTAAADAMGRTDKVLTSLLQAAGHALSRTHLQRLMEQGLVRSGTVKIASGAAPVQPGQRFTVTLPPPEVAAPAAEKIPLTIVFEDKHVLVINKPAGLVVHPAPGNKQGTLVNALLAHCGKSLSGIGGVARPGIVHRLDKDTSGLMVVAKTDVAHQGLSKQFADRSLSRTYQALVYGVPQPPKGKIEGNIGRSGGDRKKMALLATGGKPALTYYKVLENLGKLALLECILATGRTHQIRVHLASIGHGVVGDAAYSLKSKGKRIAFPRQALHAAHLKFTHPATHKSMQFSAALPDDISKLLKDLRKNK